MRRFKLNFIVLISTLLLANSSYAVEYKEVTWDDLMPPGWLPPEYNYEEEYFGDDAPYAGPGGQPANPEINDEGDVVGVPKEIAPVVEELNNRNLRLPGYVIPIKFTDKGVKEFLLVPYIGACIHVPPPPENQMVYVTLKEPLAGQELWAPVWVSGKMTTKLTLTQYTAVGYHMVEASTKIYEY